VTPLSRGAKDSAHLYGKRAGSLAALLLYLIFLPVPVWADATSATASSAASPTSPTPRPTSPTPNASHAFASPNAATPTPSATLGTKDELERQKLEQEILKLKNENDKATSVWGWVLAFAPFITVIVGVATLGATVLKQSRDLASAQRAADTQASQWREEFHQQQGAEAEKSQQWRDEFLRQQRLDRENRETEQLRRFDERLTHVAADITSDKPALRLNGAAGLGFFIKDRYPDLQCDLLNLVVANLKAKPEQAVASLLRTHLAKILRLLFAEDRSIDPEVGDRIDLSRLELYRLDLHGVNFKKAIVLDLAFSDLTQANFSESNLFRARGGETRLDNTRFSRAMMDEARFNKAKTAQGPVYFHATSLVSATFDDAVLPGADFQEARLQGAKFRRADLSGAHFEGANLSDAYFYNAQLDEAARRSIALGGLNWRNAHFDPAVVEHLDELSASSTSTLNIGP
jgi:uncharacterized protein YjbI with pentapeptide repeats